ncbi:MAG: S9 family peptidase [Candidatus Zixiibacteriota bacterium]|nr:MAG: S9 family peptidase [candidate division Zixibacteria bacterium]
MFNTRCMALILATLLFVLGGCGVKEKSLEQPAKTASLLDQGKYIPDIATFLTIGGNEPAGVSWDGSKVFFTSKMSGAEQVYRITGEGWPYQLTTFEDGIDFFRLSRNAQMGIVGASVGGSEQSQLYLVDANTGRVLQLTYYEDVRFGGVAWSPDDKYIYYYSNEENRVDFFIYRMDIATGESKKIFGETGGVTGWNWLVDLSQDGKFALIDNGTSNVSNDLYLLNLETGEYEKLNEDEGNVEYLSPTLMPDNKTVLLRCNGNEDGITRLAKMTAGSPVIEFIDDGWLDPQWELEGLGVSRDYKIMTVLINEDGYQRLRMRNLETMKEIDGPPLEGMVTHAYVDRDHNIYVGFNSPTRAPDVWKWDPGSKELTQLSFSIYAGIDQSVFREPKLIHFKSFDSLEIPAFLYLPPDYQEGQPTPFIVYAHGGPESQFQPDFIRSFQYLILNGYGILAPNPRGSAGYGREYRDMDNYKNRQKSLWDYKAGADWLIENGYTKAGMLGIRGGSYGGYVVLGMITEYPKLFSAAIDIVGISNFRTFLENTSAYRRKYRETEYGPLSDPEFLESVSPLNKAHLIETPLLVIHGVNDPRVPIGEAYQIIDAINKRGGVVDSMIFSDEGHGSGKLSNTIEQYRKQVEFLDRHLKVIESNKGKE